jgi:MoxR-like ATPase
LGTSIKQVLSGLWHASSPGRGLAFSGIIGHDDVKMIINKSILSKKPCHILLTGKPGCAKTMFLTEIMKSLKDSYFVVGSNATKAGLVNQLFERQPKFLLIDELDKMPHQDQTSLLHLMESGIVSETKIKKTRQIELTSWVFATANSYEEIIEPLLSRFLVMEVPEYTFEEFSQISVARLARENIREGIARFIAERVWNELGSKDIRDVIKVGRLASDINDVPFIIKMMTPKQT